MGFSIVYKKLIFKVIKIAFRISCIMLIVEKVNYLSMSQKHYMKP